jgi:hypothetical protein
MDDRIHDLLEIQRRADLPGQIIQNDELFDRVLESLVLLLERLDGSALPTLRGHSVPPGRRNGTATRARAGVGRVRRVPSSRSGLLSNDGFEAVANRIRIPDGDQF